MQSFQNGDGVTARIRILCTAALLAASLSGCGLFKPSAEEELSREVENLLAFEAFGGATFSVAGNRIDVTSENDAEAGIYIRAAAQVSEPIIVQIGYFETEPLNLRLLTDRGHEYRAAAGRTFVVLGNGYASEALFYSSGPLDFSIEVQNTSHCGKEKFYCAPGRGVSRTFSASGLKNRVLIGTYGSATIDQIGKRSGTIRRDASAGEFELTLNLAPDSAYQNYLLEFDVEHPEQIQLRVERAKQLRYHSATRGWARLDSDTEILLFTSDLNELEIRNVRLLDCDKDEWRCRTAEDFEVLLPGDPSEISKERLVVLTEWVSQNADYAASQSVADSVDVTGLTASQMYYKYYEPSRAGGYCGATAVFLARTLRSQGFETFTIDFGLKSGDLTHVTTIVAHEDNFFMMDATFGAYFAVPGTNEPIDLMDVLDGAPYEFRTLDMSTREFIVSQSDKDRFARMKKLNLVTNCNVSPDFPVIVCNSPGFGLEAYLYNFSSSLSEHNLESSPQTLIELLRLGVFSIGASDDTDNMRRFAKELDARNIPLDPSARRLLSN